MRRDVYEREREGGREGRVGGSGWLGGQPVGHPSDGWIIPQMTTVAWAESVQNQKLLPGLPLGCWGPSIWTIFYCFARCVIKALEQKQCPYRMLLLHVETPMTAAQQTPKSNSLIIYKQSNFVGRRKISSL